ncbi:MAG: 2-hydroxyacid dehydrogenase family protein [Anaerolineae bacterium]
MGKPKVLFLTDRGERHQQWALSFAPPQLEVIMRRAPSFEQLAALLGDIDFIISERNQPITASMIAAAPQLKLIIRLGSLSYDIDHAAAQTRNIPIVVQPVLGTIYCAEHALMMILALCKRLGRGLYVAANTENTQARRGDENIFSFNWNNFYDIGSLYGKTIGILGMGEIGVELARRLKPFGTAAVLYHKRTPFPVQVQQDLGVIYAEYAEVLRAADILISLLPYSDETEYQRGGGLSKVNLALLKPTALLVHLGSGSVVDEAAVAEMIRLGTLSGAAFDTYEYEPLRQDNPLIPLARDPNANVLLTPHTAAASAPSSRADDYAAILRYLGL